MDLLTKIKKMYKTNPNLFIGIGIIVIIVMFVLYRNSKISAPELPPETVPQIAPEKILLGSPVINILPSVQLPPTIVQFNRPIEIVSSGFEVYKENNSTPDALFDGIVYQNNMWETRNNTYINGISAVETSKIIGSNNISYNGEFVKIKYNKPYILTKYEFYHRGNGTNTSPATEIVGNLPKKWFILGSNDNINWELIHSIENFTAYELNKPTTFSVSNNTLPYNNYAIVVNQLVSEQSTKLSLGEWKLYGY